MLPLAHLPISVSCHNTDLFGCQIINSSDGPTMNLSVGMNIKIPVADILKALATCQESIEVPARGQAVAPKAVTASQGMPMPAAVAPAAGPTSAVAPKWAEDQQKRSPPAGMVPPAEVHAQASGSFPGRQDSTPSNWFRPICHLQTTHADYADKNIWVSELPNKCSLANKDALQDTNFTALPLPARTPLTHANFSEFSTKSETSAVSSSTAPEPTAPGETPARSGPAKIPPPVGAPPPPPGSNGNSGPPPKSSAKVASGASAPKKVPPPTASVEASPPNKAPPPGGAQGSSPTVKTPPPKMAPPKSPASENEVAAKAVAKAAEQASAATKVVSDPPKDCKQQ